MFLSCIVAFSACNRPVKTQNFASLPHTNPALQAVDSLMWRQPDSAFAQLRQFVASPQADSLDEFNVHYCQLLISELLYKNDWGQRNREELLQAVTYFDSIMQVPEPVEGPSFERNVFLAARAHYINGVGYYENDSIVQACAEYLKALEVMEAHFEEKELVGHKARFMAYTYNRLGDLFSEQFMMEPAIASYENALHYCRIEPTSPQGLSNILYRLGQQYDMKGEKGKARIYYGKALEKMPNANSLSYRDLVAIKALSDYQVGMGIDKPLNTLKNIVIQTDDESERLTRFVAIGDIFFEERIYDSAIFYLEPVFKKAENNLSQVQAAEYLRIIYDILGDADKAEDCTMFLASQKKTEGQNKILVSQLNDAFQSYIIQRQEVLFEKSRLKSIKRTACFVAAVAIVVIAVFVLAKRRSRKLLKQQQEKADKALEETALIHERELEAERQIYLAKQAAISGRLKKSNQELQRLKEQVKQQDDRTTSVEKPESFVEEPICQLIMNRVKEGQFKSKINSLCYREYALDKEHLLALRLATDRHYCQFTTRLKKAYPKLTNIDIDYCCLYLLGLSDADVAALMQRAYNTVIERNVKLRKVFCCESTKLSVTLRELTTSLYNTD